ncbi:uncharacterized protein PAC_00984 [Phialocephala subalpina]|uniref:BTB domain-containing protein n=1 Tax=Phialocephala subalpina TaxID=576137 RepID=A0A1L7WEG4_9HELO|nr:uncharacterized protein PAC_00984 [Phialocephala subalpina]
MKTFTANMYFGSHYTVIAVIEVTEAASANRVLSRNYHIVILTFFADHIGDSNIWKHTRRSEPSHSGDSLITGGSKRPSSLSDGTYEPMQKKARCGERADGSAQSGLTFSYFRTFEPLRRETDSDTSEELDKLELEQLSLAEFWVLVDRLDLFEVRVLSMKSLVSIFEDKGLLDIAMVFEYIYSHTKRGSALRHHAVSFVLEMTKEGFNEDGESLPREMLSEIAVRGKEKARRRMAGV